MITDHKPQVEIFKKDVVSLSHRVKAYDYASINTM